MNVRHLQERSLPVILGNMCVKKTLRLLQRNVYRTEFSDQILILPLHSGQMHSHERTSRAVYEQNDRRYCSSNEKSGNDVYEDNRQPEVPEQITPF